MSPLAQAALDDLLRRRPDLHVVSDSLVTAFHLILDSQRAGGLVMVCGNGGSAADSVHIVGELLKQFGRERPLSAEVTSRLRAAHPTLGPYLAQTLQTPMRAISLCSEIALMTAVANDTAADVLFAQQVLAHGKPGDVLLAITTSGNSANVLNAVVTAKALDCSVIALTGPGGGKIKELADCTILAPGANTPEIQEAHLPIYHTLCAMLEDEMFGAPD
jgi:D-sedoheptulose 7-phosphate isomerase